MHVRTIATWSAIIIAMLVVAGCGGDDGSDGSDDARDAKPTTTEPADTGGDGPTDGPPGDAPTDAPPSPDADVATFSVSQAGGVAKGGPKPLRVTRGEPVVIEISSDTADEAHLHGIDATADVPAGGSARLEFTPQDPGSYELEMHDTGALLATVIVS